MTWKDDWDETFDTIRKKVLSDTQSYGYMTSIDDIINWPDHDWYNTELNPVKPVSFIAKNKKIDSNYKNIPYFSKKCAL